MPNVKKCDDVHSFRHIPVTGVDPGGQVPKKFGVDGTLILMSPPQKKVSACYVHLCI